MLVWPDAPNAAAAALVAFWAAWPHLGKGQRRPATICRPVYHAMPDLLTEITDAAKAYYAQATSFPLTATDFYDWMAALPPARRAEVLAQGLPASQAEPEFLRFCLEWRGYDMRAFMAARLSAAAFELWVTNGEFNGDLPPHGIGR